VGVLQFGENAEKDRPIVERLASRLGSKPVYVEGDAHALFEELSKSAGPLFGAYKDEDRVIAVRPGENAFLLRVNQAIEETKAAGAGR
jgi:hypothetical protein